MKKQKPRFHYRRIATSIKLQKLYRYLARRKEATGLQIAMHVGTTCPSTLISELRHNSVPIKAEQRNRVWYYSIEVDNNG